MYGLLVPKRPELEKHSNKTSGLFVPQRLELVIPQVPKRSTVGGPFASV